MIAVDPATPRKLLVLCLVVCASSLAQDAAPPPDTYTQPRRIVAVGDVHGDFKTFTEVLRAAGILDKRNRWIGGKAHLVQTGDVVDRGPDSRKVVNLLIGLEKQAARAGGRVHSLLGNHETMNLYGDLRYVSAEEFASYKQPQSAEIRENFFREFILSQNKDSAVTEDQLRRDFDEDHPLGWVEHRHAFSPNGDVGKWLRAHNTIVKVGDTLFLHAGIGPKYAATPRPEINNAVRSAIATLSALDSSILTDPDGPLWYRALAFGPEAPLATHVDAVLKFHNAKRIVIGHTFAMPAILPRFDGKVIVIDCGLSSAYTGTPAALIIEADGKAFALHRGKLLPLPATNAGVLGYLKQAAVLDPQPSPITQFLQGNTAATGDDSSSSANKR